jgi:hypothetical protein
MSRKILLIEPDYQNKYPPIGLMKIASYHRILGDHVTFYKGNLPEFVLQTYFERSIFSLRRVSKKINWKKHSEEIKLFIKTRDSNYLQAIGLSKHKLKQTEVILTRYFEIIQNKQFQN